jgi:hypothetical protein
MYCQPLLEGSPGNHMVLVMAALLMSDDRGTVTNTGLQNTRRKLPEVVGRDVVTNTVLDSIPKGSAPR